MLAALLHAAAACTLAAATNDCEGALAEGCLSARTTGGFGGCEICAGERARGLQAAGCLPTQIASFCNVSKCGVVLNKDCLSARTTGGSGGCMFCAGAHQSALQAAGCLQPQIAAFCNTAKPPPAVDQQCALPYKNVSDAWRTVTNDCSAFDGPSKDCKKGAGGPGGNNMGDTFLGDVNCVGSRRATGVGDGGWYRFGGAGGDVLPLRPPGGNHCGTEMAGWLSGWDASPGCVYPNCTPPKSYSTPGRYPAATEGVAEMTACFDGSYPGQHEQCYWHELVGVVRCDGFLLWRLPYSGGCSLAYCSTNASGLR